LRKNSLFDYWWNVNGALYLVQKKHFKLQKQKSWPLQPFGGLSIMFYTISSYKWHTLISTNIKPTLSFTKQTKKNIGKSVWQNIHNAK
jgi:hypothetical protein